MPENTSAVVQWRPDTEKGSERVFGTWTRPRLPPAIVRTALVSLPDFLIIGGQRCGSTWLYRGLKANPSIFLPDKKELEFFSYSRTNTSEGLADYKGFFSPASSSQVRGEATPSYFWVSDEYPEWVNRPDGFETDIPGRVKATLGDETVLILTLRNPVERAVSAFAHHVRMGRLDPRKGVIESGRQAGIIHMGFYGAHLARWLEQYEPHNFQILVFERAVASPEETFHDLSRRLGVPEVQGIDRSGRANAGLSVEQTQRGAELEDSSGERVVVASRDELKAMRDLYAPDIERLAGLIGTEDLADLWLGVD